MKKNSRPIRFPVETPEELRNLLEKFENRLKTEAGYIQENARRFARGAGLFVDYLEGKPLEKKNRKKN